MIWATVIQAYIYKYSDAGKDAYNVRPISSGSQSPI